MTLAEPAIMKFQFMKTPMKAVNPMKIPRISAAPNQQFTDRHEFGEPDVIAAIQHGLDEGAIPVKGDGGACRRVRDDYGAIPEAFQRFAALHPGGVGDLAPARFDPLVTEIQADDEPQPGYGFACEEGFDIGNIIPLIFPTLIPYLEWRYASTS